MTARGTTGLSTFEYAASVLYDTTRAWIGESGCECFWLMELYWQKKRNLLVPLERILFPTLPDCKPLESHEWPGPSPEDFNCQAISTAGKGKFRGPGGEA